MNFQTMHRQREFILIAAAAGVISMFLPWVSISAFGMDVGQSNNGLKGGGILIFFLFAAVLVMAIINNPVTPLSRLQWFLTLIAGAVNLIFTIRFFAGAPDEDAFGLVEASPGVGLWLASISSLCILIGAWAYKRKEDTLKSGFEQLKSRFPGAAAPTSTDTTTPAATTKLQELERLIALRRDGHISEQEFQTMKATLKLDT